MAETKCALIGCGSMGSDLARHFVTVPGASIVACVDTDADWAAKRGAEFGAEHGADIESMLGRGDIDAVIVASPGFAHAEHVVASLEAGKNVFCEKPLALVPSECERMIRARDAAGRILMVGQVLRYIGVFNYTRDLVAGGALGEIATLRITRTSSGWGGAWQPWRNKEALSGGVLFEFSVHELDFMMCLAGDPASVYATSSSTTDAPVDYPDTYQLSIRFESGAMGQLTAGIADHIGRYGGEIMGTRGSVHFDMRAGEILTKVGDDELETISPDSFDLENPVRRELREFVEAVRGDGPVTIPAEDGMRVVRLAHAAKTSAREGRVVEL